MGGTYTAAVLVRSGGTSYTVQVNPDEAPPGPLADFEFSSSGSEGSGRFQTFNFNVQTGETINAQITWDDPNADVRVFLRDETRTQVDRDTTGVGSAMVSGVATTSGEWSVAVRVRSATTVNYDILVNTN